MNRIRLIVTFLFISGLTVFAKAPIKFGKISLEEMEMKTYEQDTSASAVILCKYGLISSKYTLIKRVKIMKQSGVDHSDLIFNGLHKSAIRARVYNMENGEIVEEDVKNESIFKERITNSYYAIRVALPNVKVGSVYDIEITGNFHPSEFSFQENMPIKHVELQMYKSDYIRKRPVGEQIYKKNKDQIYVADYVPAFKSEPFINSENNYISKFEFDILATSSAYVSSGFGTSASKAGEYTTSWEAVNERLSASRYFGGTLKLSSNYLSDIVSEIEAKHTDPYDKMEAALFAIRQLKWNERESLYMGQQSLAKTYEEGEGNSAEINLIFIQLLNRLNIEALPVVLSTRENGLLNRVYPSFLKLNYVIVSAKINNTKYLLDATAEKMPIGMLPLRCLNQQGRLVNDRSGAWIDLNPQKGEEETVMYTLELKDDLTLEGSMQYNRKNYSAYNWRISHKEFMSEDEYLENMESNFAGLRIKTSNINNIEDINLPIQDTYEVSIKNMVNSVGDQVILNPFLFEKMEENPFKMDHRKYPIDFAYTRKKSMVSKCIIPPTLTVSELPKPIYITFPDNSASVFIKYEVLNNMVTVTYKFNIEKPMFFPSEYQYLKHLYAITIEKQAEPIILKRNENSEAN